MKNTTTFFIGIASLMLISACSLETPQNSEPSTEVTNFEECMAAGNLVMESYPRQCRDGENLFIEEVEVEPAPDTETPDGKPCTREYRPVCGKIQVQCIKAPCPPLDTTFVNKCEAENAGATDIREGECEDEAINPEGACLSFDGNWLPETNECEGMSAQMCEELGGTYNECASACRNDPEAEMCTMQCVLVCQF